LDYWRLEIIFVVRYDYWCLFDGGLLYWCWLRFCRWLEVFFVTVVKRLLFLGSRGWFSNSFCRWLEHIIVVIAIFEKFLFSCCWLDWGFCDWLGRRLKVVFVVIAIKNGGFLNRSRHD
jgi:hypothetical protein